MLRKLAHLSIITLSVCISLTSFNSFAHGKHSHGHQQSESARKANEGVFTDKEVKDRLLSDWDGVWQSINPYLLKGDLDPVLVDKAKKNKNKTVEEYRKYYKKGYATDITMIGIENNTIDFHTPEAVNSCQYRYSGFKIMHYESGKKGCVIYMNAKIPTLKHLSMSNLVTTLLNRKNPITSIFTWVTSHKKNCLKKWITGRLFTR